MLYLHAGTVKTGTTYIQKVMHENRDLFCKHGLEYLPVAMSDLELPRYANAKFLYDYSLTTGARTDILKAQGANILVSEEGLWGYADHLLNPIFDGVPKKIVLYIRPTAEVLSAWAAEHCHPYNVLSLPDNQGFHAADHAIYPLHRLLDIAVREYAVSMGRLIDIIDTIGCDSFIIRPYEKSSLLKGDLLSDFFQILGLDEDAIRKDPDFKDSKLVNITGTRKYCDVSRIAWETLGRPNVLDVFNYSLIQDITQMCTSGDSRSVVETLSNEQISSLTGRFEWFERYISRNFLENQPLFENKYPACFGIDRDAYSPVNVREVEILLELLQMRKAF